MLHFACKDFNMARESEDIWNIQSMDQIRSDAEIQSSNMFKLDILIIQKVRIRSNMQYFKFLDNLLYTALVYVKYYFLNLPSMLSFICIIA